MKKKIAYIHMLRTLLFALNEIKEFEEKFNLINQNKSITKNELHTKTNKHGYSKKLKEYSLNAFKTLKNKILYSVWLAIKLMFLYS
ncbi:hypothetical protein RRG48_03665 [Mycoplasmopsis canis]|uniref:hypothetical protein n=1 Tax=Mycoplasmopsis cynos TaxID=171284 RepID=UPI002AFEA947|nr:hypothetical protein [Mycoplasmopsis cynos]WQQ13170.1 hypothetical protein RRG58_00225 [Mycoplasmopsis cynos]WQQ14094.1 hypothetical protein RRG52_00925 [Mycoplasmopsis cynos]